MTEHIQEILNDLYAMDPDLTQHEDELKEIIHEMLLARPDTKFSPEFAQALKERLHGDARRARAAKAEPISWYKQVFKNPWTGVFAFAVVILIALGVWNSYFRVPSSPARFVLKASSADSAGIEPGTKFTLQSSQPITARDIKKIVKFEPAVDFDVNKVASQIAFVQEATAENEDTKSYAYELKPKTELAGNEVYKVSIADKQYAEREYGWAFQVKSNFNVTKTHPGNKGVYVPTNTGIEITFNRSNIEDIDKHFSITPTVEGRFEIHDDTVVFIPKNPLKAGTVYTITLSKGITSKGSKDSLSDDYKFAFETQDSGSNYQTAYLSFNNDFIEYVPNTKPVLGMYSYSIDPADMKARVYQFSSPDEFIASYQKSRSWEWSWASYYRQQGNTAYDTKNMKAIAEFTPEIITKDYQTSFELPETLKAGFYLVELQAGSIKKQAWLQVTPVSNYFAVTHDNGLLWVYDYASKAPYQDATIAFVKDGFSATELGKTGSDGLSQFTTPEPLKSENLKDNLSPAFFKVTKGNTVTWVKAEDYWGYGSQGADKGDQYWKHLSTDRYAYQMSDTIKFWGVVKGRTEDVRQKEVKISLYDSSRFIDYSLPYSKQEPVMTKTVMVSAFNTITGELAFKGLAPKTYTLVATYGEDTVGSASVEVLTYSKPTYQISVTTSKPAIYAGDEVTFHAKAAFFDGTPASGMQLKYSGYWTTEINGEVTLNDNGEADVKVRPEYNEGTYNYWPRSLSLTFTPSFGEEGEITGTGNVTVFGPHMYLQATQEKQSGDSYLFKAKLNNIDIANQVPDESGVIRTEYIAGPVPNYNVQADVIQTTYDKIETGEYYDPINKTVNKTYNYEPKTTTIDTVNGNTNGNGEWQFTKNLPQKDLTYYTVTFKVTDREGRHITTNAYAWYSYYDVWQPSGLSLSIGDQTYQKDFSVGEQVNLTVTNRKDNSFNGKPILLYRFQNNIGKAVILNKGDYSEQFNTAFLPSVQYRAVSLGAYGFEESNAVYATFKKTDNELNISLTPDKESYRPGDKVHLGLTITDKQGKPVAAEANVAVVDEAVFHVLPYTWQQQILDSLYQPIYGNIITGHTQYATAQDSGRGGAEGGGCFLAGTQILLVNGQTKGIEQLKVGDEILTFTSEAQRTLARATIQGISSHLVEDYVIINGKLKVTPEHKIYLNGTWDFAGNSKIGDTLVLANGKPETIHSVEKVQAHNTEVYNIVVGKYHTYFAEGYYVHNAEKGGNSVRDTFADTAAFQTVQSGTDGKASLDITLADNLTSWRVTAQVFEPSSIRAGQKTKLLPATLPLFTNAVLADTYLNGDNPNVKVTMYGTDYKPNNDAEITISSPSLNLNQTVTLKNHTAYITLPNLTAGVHDIIITAKQGNLSDSIKRTIQVVPTTFVKPVSSDKAAQNGNNQLQGNPNAFTRVEFIDAGKGKFYNELLWGSYSNGVRIDQATTYYFAQKMLNDYFGKHEQLTTPDLSAYHTPDSGIRLFPYSDPDLELSAKTADLARDFVFKDQLVTYFNQSLRDKKTDIHRQAIALYGLASLGEPVLTKLQAIQQVPDLTWQDKTYIGLGLAKLGDKETARSLYEQDIRGHLHFDGPQAWVQEEQDKTKQVKTTDLVGILASYAGRTDDSGQIWNYLETHYPERDLDTIERLIFIRSELAQYSSADAKLSYTTSGRTEQVNLKNGNMYSVNLSSDELSSLTISNLEGSVRIATFFEQPQDPATITKNGQLGITRKYVVNNKETTTFKEGDIVRVKLYPTVSKEALDGQYQIVDHLPAGLKPLTNPYTYGVEQGGYSCIWYPQQIVNNSVYFSVPKEFGRYTNCEPAIQYYARATGKGTFTGDPAVLQSVTNLDSMNITDKVKIEVK